MLMLLVRKSHLENYWSAINTMTLILALHWNHLGDKQAKLMKQCQNLTSQIFSFSRSKMELRCGTFYLLKFYLFVSFKTCKEMNEFFKKIF